MNVAEQRFRLAINLFNQGDLDAARRECQAVLKLAPKQPDVLHMIGLIAYRTGNLAEAEKFLAKAVKIAPDHLDSLFNLGVVYRDRGKLSQAQRQFARVSAMRPDSLDALINLSLVQRDLGDLTAAEETSLNVVERAPGSSAAHNNLGVVYSLTNRLKEAEAAFRKSIDLKPDHVNAVQNLAHLLHRWDERKFDAGDLYRRALEIQPGDITAAMELFEYLVETGTLEEVQALFEEMAETFAGTSGLILAEAKMFDRQGRETDALERLADGAKQYPEDDEIAHFAAKLLVQTGRFDEAIAAYRVLVDRNPMDGMACLALTDLAKIDIQDPLFAQMRRAAKRPDIEPLELERLMFAMARAQDRSGDFDAAFRSLEKGNRMRRARLDYDADRNTRFIAEMCALFSRERIEATRLSTSVGESPIFIVGMPRSGTTLTEQILASHSGVVAGGELVYLTENIRELATRMGDDVPAFVERIGHDDLIGLGEAYHADTAPLRQEGKVLTDKLPHNFLNIGFIRMIWPDARIVHVRRHPAGTCFSIYSQLFLEAHNYAYDLEELGRYYHDYRTLMAHWNFVCDKPIYDLDYETFVRDPESETRRLLDYCGLPFEEACLSFHETDRSVRTASRIQVRQPLYTSSADRWRNYEGHLKPLMDAIGDV